MTEQIGLLGESDRQQVESFVASRQLPEPITDSFVKAVQKVLRRFVVRLITPRDVWDALVPDAAPATPDELIRRFTALLNELVGDEEVERVARARRP